MATVSNMNLLLNMNSTDIGSSIKETIKLNEIKQLKLNEVKQDLLMTDEERLNLENEDYYKELFEDLNFWSTEKIEIFDKLSESGQITKYKNIKPPYYDNNIGVRRPNIDFGYTQHEINEIEKCKNDVLYFAENYCFTLTPTGYKQIQLRDYQKRVLTEIYEHNFDILLLPRQSGKTTMATIFLTWFAMFNDTKNLLILANKGETMAEIINKIKEVYINLPFFLKCGVNRWGETFIKFENKCRIFGQSTTKSAAVGFTVHLLYIDEFAHIHKNIIEPFFENVYPVLSAPENIDVARFIITSTSNGINKFSELYNNAVAGKNSFHAIRVDWWEIPGRDEKWKEQMIADSSIEAFNRQFGNQFLVEGNLLLPRKIQQLWSRYNTEFISKEMDYTLDNLDEKEISKFKWKPNFNIDELLTGTFVISVDFSDGNGGDYGIMNIFKLAYISDAKMRTQKKRFKIKDYIRLEQIGYFRDNNIPLSRFGEIFMEFIFKCFNVDKIKIILEVNDNRYLQFYSDLMRHRDFYDEMLYRSYQTEKATQKKVGLKLNKNTKLQNLINIKHKLISTNIVVSDLQTQNEMKTFTLMKNGTYQSTCPNDDLAISVFNTSVFFDDEDFENLVEDFIEQTGQDIENKILSLIDNNIDILNDGNEDMIGLLNGLNF